MKKPMNFDIYKANFAYRGKAIYRKLYAFHGENIKTKKPKFAVNNLEKIFNATFKIASRIGFHEMSLRDLCRETGLSMGGIYSCIESKDVIAIMVKDIVKIVVQEIIEDALKQEDKQKAIDDIIRHLIYASEILQHWFHFLYFETRSLPLAHQEDSKQLELSFTDTFVELVTELQGNTRSSNQKYRFAATMALAMIQERYLKQWKYKNHRLSVDDYADEVLQLVHAALR